MTISRPIFRLIGPLLVLGGLLQSSSLVNQTRIEEQGDYRYIISNGVPNHPTGEFPNPGNPNRISAQNHTFRMPLYPEFAESATPVRPIFGVALNGVPFEPGTAEAWENDRSTPWRFEALTGFINLGVDEHNAHVQPTGSYHYHGVPTGLLHSEHTMVHIGYGADGFPVYGPHGYADANDASSNVVDVHSSYRLKEGLRPDGPGGLHDGAFVGDFEYVAGLGDLDECNGRFGATPEYPEGTYHYYITESFPFIPRCLKGTPDESFLRRGGRGDGQSGNRPSGSPPGRHGNQRPGGPPPGGHPPGGPPSGPPTGSMPGGHSGSDYEPTFPDSQ